jgi:hypothetical protein
MNKIGLLVLIFMLHGGCQYSKSTSVSKGQKFDQQVTGSTDLCLRIQFPLFEGY